MSNGNIDSRLIALIESTMNSSKRFKELEEKTGISANRWQSLWHGRQRAMPDMIEVIGKIFPEYAFWLVTGITDSGHGHISPATKEVIDDRVPLDNKKLEIRYRTKRRLRTAARDYFLTSLKIAELPAWNEESDENKRETLMSKFTSLLYELDVLHEIREQQEITLMKLEEEAIQKMTAENGFYDQPRKQAIELIEEENQRDSKSSNYVAPDYPDLSF